MLSDKSRKTVEACRFCWMCRHMCPVGLATGRESNGPRAKALFISMQERGVELEKETALDMYECALCNACATNCETGYEPAAFIRDARSALAAKGLVPEKVQMVIDRLLDTGSLYEVDIAQELAKLKNPGSGKLLVYAGTAAAVRAPEMLQAFLSLLGKAGVEYSLFTGAQSSASAEYDLLGGVQEVKTVCENCAKALEDTGAEKIVVLDPADAVMFKQQYPAWGIKLNAAIETATAFAASLVRDGRLAPDKSEGKVTYHDPSRLARDLEETECVRELIAAMGYELCEMWQSRKLTRSCGGEVLASHSPELVRKMSLIRLEDAERTGAQLVVTACPQSTAELTEAGTMPVADVFTLLDRMTD